MKAIYVKIYLISTKGSKANKPKIKDISVIKDSNWLPFEEKEKRLDVDNFSGKKLL